MKQMMLPLLLATLMLPLTVVAEDGQPTVEIQQVDVKRSKKSVIAVDRSEQESQKKTVRNAPFRPKGPVSIEEQLWQLYTDGNMATLLQRIADLKARNTGWNPPVELLKQIELSKADKQLQSAQQRGDYAEAIRIYQESPEAFACERLGWALFLAEGQLRQGDPKGALSTYQRLLRSCDNPSKVAALEHAQGVIRSDQWQPLVESQIDKKYSGEERARLDRLWYKVLLQRVQEASDNKAYDTVYQLGRQLQPQVIKYEDPLAAEILGWAFFGGKYYDQGLANFTYSFDRTKSPDALRGKAFCLGELGQFDDLDTLVEENRATMNREGLMKDLLPLMIGNAMRKDNHQRAMALLDELEKIRPLSMGEMSMRAWSLYHFEKFDQAAEKFLSLYELKPDREVAKGIYYSLIRIGQRERILYLSNELGDPFKSVVQVESGANDLAANSLVGGDMLNNVKEPFFRTGHMSKIHLAQGLPAFFSKMTLRKEWIEANRFYNDLEFNVRVERFRLDAGTGTYPEPLNALLPADPGYNVGTMTVTPGQVNYVIPVPATRHHGQEWSIGVSKHSTDGNLYAEVGQLISKSAVRRDSLKFRVGYAKALDSAVYQIEGYRQPLRETLISFLGMPDPYQGRLSWGQVSRNGARLSGFYGFRNKVSVSGNFSLESIDGHNVAQNGKAAAYLGITRDISPRGFNYFAIGPYLRWESSEHNHNHWTYGYGNYFSPQSLYDWGLAATFMTDTGKSWLLQGDASIGRQETYEAGGAYFPLTNNVGSPVLPNMYLGKRNAEHHYQLKLAGIVALSKRWRINAEYKFALGWPKAPLAVGAVPPLPMKEHAFMLALTYHFEDRGETLNRSDFTSFRLNPLY